jgi:hypothetical protein
MPKYLKDLVEIITDLGLWKTIGCFLMVLITGAWSFYKGLPAIQILAWASVAIFALIAALLLMDIFRNRKRKSLEIVENLNLGQISWHPAHDQYENPLIAITLTLSAANLTDKQIVIRKCIYRYPETNIQLQVSSPYNVLNRTFRPIFGNETVDLICNFTIPGKGIENRPLIGDVIIIDQFGFKNKLKYIKIPYRAS